MSKLLHNGFQPVSETEMMRVAGGSVLVATGVVAVCMLLSGCVTLQKSVRKTQMPQPRLNRGGGSVGRHGDGGHTYPESLTLAE